MLISDGIEQEEYEELKRGFEQELAEVFSTSPQEYLTIETVSQHRRGKDITIDFPLEAVEAESFDGLIIPDGLLSTDLLRRDLRVIELVQSFHQLRLPIFASGRAVDILYASHTLPEQVLVREGSPMSSFIQQAVEVLLESASTPSNYQVGNR